MSAPEKLEMSTICPVCPQERLAAEATAAGKKMAQQTPHDALTGSLQVIKRAVISHRVFSTQAIEFRPCIWPYRLFLFESYWNAQYHFHYRAGRPALYL
jgi:hypothetical protein